MIYVHFSAIHNYVTCLYYWTLDDGRLTYKKIYIT